MDAKQGAFGVKDVLKVALKLEEGGALFYKRAAQVAGEGELKTMLERLAKEETVHANSYANTLKTLADEQCTITDDNVPESVMTFLGEWVKGNSFLCDADPSALVSNSHCKDDLIRIAIKLENKSIALYAAMRQLAKDDGTKKLVNQIMNEELMHVVHLGKLL